MSKVEHPLQNLQHFLPPGTFPLVLPYFQAHTIHLNLTRERRSVLGDYRPPNKSYPYHRISVNINLNPYSFLITLVHELAHLRTFAEAGNRVAPHGPEWKQQFGQMLLPFSGQSYFPQDVEAALRRYIANPAASTCTDPSLFRALYRYDKKPQDAALVEDVPLEAHFRTHDGKLFRKLRQVRTRARCVEVDTGKIYLFPNIVEVLRQEGPDGHNSIRIMDATD